MFEDMQKTGKSPTAMMGGFNPLVQLYSTLKMEDLKFDSNYVSVTSKGFEGKSSQTTILDSNTDTVEVKDGNFSMKDGFELSYNYGASGVKAMTDKMQAQNADKPDGFEIKTAMEAMTLNGFQMRLEDKSIVERSLKLAGEMRGASPGSFVDNGGTLSIVIAPKEPLPMSQLADYKNSSLTMEQIGFTAKAE